MPKARAIDETPDNHHAFLDCLQLEFETLPQMMFLEGTKDHDLVEPIHPCSWPPLLSCCVRLRQKRCVACDAFHRVALFHVARFNYLFVKLFPMLDAFCSFEFFCETLDGARRV
jgi:hypothetical protein